MKSRVLFLNVVLFLGGILFLVIYWTQRPQKESMVIQETASSFASSQEREKTHHQVKAVESHTIEENTPKIKGNRNANGHMIYHVPGGQFYERVKTETLFYTEEEAQQAGYRKSLR